jgi:gas vesicle protein
MQKSRFLHCALHNEKEKEIDMADNNGASGLGWFVAGLSLGALAGVLYAPKAGKETREDIAAGAREAKERAGELAEQGRVKAREFAEQGKQQVNEYVDRGREYYDRGRTQWSQYVEKGKGMVAEQQDKLSAAIDAGKDAYVTTTHDTGNA